MIKRATTEELLRLNIKYLRKGGRATRDNYRIWRELSRRYGGFSVPDASDLEGALKMHILKNHNNMLIDSLKSYEFNGCYFLGGLK